MAKSSFRFRSDEKLVGNATDIFDKIGLSLDSALNMFLKQTVLKHGLPLSLVVSDITDEKPKKTNKTESNEIAPPQPKVEQNPVSEFDAERAFQQAESELYEKQTGDIEKLDAICAEFEERLSSLSVDSDSAAEAASAALLDEDLQKKIIAKKEIASSKATFGERILSISSMISDSVSQFGGETRPLAEQLLSKFQTRLTAISSNIAERLSALEEKIAEAIKKDEEKASTESENTAENQAENQESAESKENEEDEIARMEAENAERAALEAQKIENAKKHISVEFNHAMSELHEKSLFLFREISEKYNADSFLENFHSQIEEQFDIARGEFLKRLSELENASAEEIESESLRIAQKTGILNDSIVKQFNEISQKFEQEENKRQERLESIAADFCERITHLSAALCAKFSEAKSNFGEMKEFSSLEENYASKIEDEKSAFMQKVDFLSKKMLSDETLERLSYEANKKIAELQDAANDALSYLEKAIFTAKEIRLAAEKADAERKEREERAQKIEQESQAQESQAQESQNAQESKIEESKPSQIDEEARKAEAERRAAELAAYIAQDNRIRADAEAVEKLAQERAQKIEQEKNAQESQNAQESKIEESKPNEIDEEARKAEAERRAAELAAYIAQDNRVRADAEAVEKLAQERAQKIEQEKQAQESKPNEIDEEARKAEAERRAAELAAYIAQDNRVRADAEAVEKLAQERAQKIEQEKNAEEPKTEPKAVQETAQKTSSDSSAIEQKSIADENQDEVPTVSKIVSEVVREKQAEEHEEDEDESAPDAMFDSWGED